MAAPLSTNNSSLARWLRRRGSRHVSTQSPVIVGGCQRSGTTLLRVMLDSHPNIACGPETSLLTGGYRPEKLARRFDITPEAIAMLRQSAKDHAHFIEEFFSLYAATRRKPRWAEKTPQNVRHIDYIFAHFPNAKFIHVIRDGRDVVCSVRTHPRFRIVNGEKVPTNIRRPLAPCIDNWLRDTAAGMKSRGRPNYYEVHYEQLVESPEPTLRRLCEFIGEPWDGRMLDYHREPGPSREPTHFITNEAATRPLSRQALHRWRVDLSEDEQRLFYHEAGQRLTEFGYEIEEPAAIARGGR